MKLHLVLACAALAAAAAVAQNAPARKITPPTDIQGVPTAPPPSSLPPNTPSMVPPSGAAPFNRPSGVIVPDRSLLPSQSAKIIINYWDVVRDMMVRVRNAPARPPRSAGRPGDLRPDYPFEEFRNLRGRDLVRAAHEGAVAARRQKAGRPELEIERQIWENAALALEYFPLVVRDDSDVQALLRIVENREEELGLRRFVLAKIAPDQKAPSLLSMFLEDAYARNPGQFGSVLDVASGHPLENPSFQREAMRTYHERLMNRYGAALAADPKIAALEKESGQPVAPASLIEKTPPAMEKATREKLRSLGYTIAAFATLIAVHIDPNSASDASVQAETRRILERIAAEVLVPDREVILRYLDPSRPAAPAPEGLPPMPVIPDTGGDEMLVPALPGAETGLPVMPNVSQGEIPNATPVPLPSGL